jgi:hypothetical protein
MARREVQIAEETRQKQSQRYTRRQALVKEQDSIKADREKGELQKERKTGKTFSAATVLLITLISMMPFW